MKLMLGILAVFYLMCITGCKLDGGGGGGSASYTSSDVSNYTIDDPVLLTDADFSKYDPEAVEMFLTSSFLADDLPYFPEEIEEIKEPKNDLNNAPVPEPASMALLTIGLGGLAAMRLRRRNKGV